MCDCGGLRPASARKLDSVWTLRGTGGGGVTCSVDCLCLGVYACLDTEALTWKNRITASKTLGFKVFLL